MAGLAEVTIFVWLIFGELNEKQLEISKI